MFEIDRRVFVNYVFWSKYFLQNAIETRICWVLIECKNFSLVILFFDLFLLKLWIKRKFWCMRKTNSKFNLNFSCRKTQLKISQRYKYMILLEFELDYIHQILYKTKNEKNKKISRTKRLFKIKRNKHAITWRWLDKDWIIKQIFWFCIITITFFFKIEFLRNN